MLAGGSDGKKSACNGGDLGSIPESGRSPGEGNGNPPQYSCLEIPWTEKPGGLIVHGVAESWSRLSGKHTHCLTEEKSKTSQSEVVQAVSEGAEMCP